MYCRHSLPFANPPWLAHAKAPKNPRVARLNVLLGQAPATQRHLKPPRPQTPPSWIRPGTIMMCMFNPLALPFLTMCSLPKFCYICLNGRQLHLCDHCPRAVCYDCLPPPTLQPRHLPLGLPVPDMPLRHIQGTGPHALLCWCLTPLPS